VVITHQRAWPSTSRIDLPWRNFLSPEFGTKFHKEVFYFRGTRISISIGQWKKAPMPKPALPFIRFDTTRPHSVKQVKRQLENRARSLIINTLRKKHRTHIDATNLRDAGRVIVRTRLNTLHRQGERSIAMSVSVCLSVCLSALISHEQHV